MKDLRRSGRTTRLIDGYVQDFFKNGACGFQDHFGGVQANRSLLYSLLRRLEFEHGIQPDTLIISLKEVTITQNSTITIESSLNETS